MSYFFFLCVLCHQSINRPTKYSKCYYIYFSKVAHVFNRKPKPVVSFLVRKMNNFENVKLETTVNRNSFKHVSIYCGALPRCPRPLDYGWLAVTSHCSKLSFIMFIVASSASGWRGQVAAEETHPSALHPSFGLILSSGLYDTCLRAEHR